MELIIVKLSMSFICLIWIRVIYKKQYSKFSMYILHYRILVSSPLYLIIFPDSLRPEELAKSIILLIETAYILCVKCCTFCYFLYFSRKTFLRDIKFTSLLYSSTNISPLFLVLLLLFVYRSDITTVN